MSKNRSLSSVFKVRLRLHYSWIAVLIFMTAAVITQFSTSYPFLQRLVLGVIASCLFLLTIVIRMFIITLLAIRKGAVIKSDTLFAIGGVLEIDETTTFPALEVLLSIIGFLINLIFAGILFTIYVIMAQTGSIMVHVFVEWLAFIYFMLTLFNLLPGLPLDGGRILRAVFWKITKKYNKTTRVFSWIGWTIGFALIITGIVLTIITKQWFVGILLALPGLILQNAATHQRRQVLKKIDKQEKIDESIALTSAG
jgi:Zn-dependent protease